MESSPKERDQKQTLTRKNTGPDSSTNASLLDRTITCKTDAAWDKTRNTARLAWNFSGTSLAKPIEGSIAQAFVASPLLAEALAALGSAKDFGFTDLDVFSDNTTLIGAINGMIQRKELIGIISDIRSISSWIHLSIFLSYRKIKKRYLRLSSKSGSSKLCNDIFSGLTLCISTWA